MFFYNLLLFVVVSFITGIAGAQPEINKFRKDERVAFIGNSITHGGHYHSFIWLYYMTRFPDQPVTIMNCGIGGESTWDMEKRLQTDVFVKNPTHVVLTFGMNDTGYGIYWDKNAQELAEQQVLKSLESYSKIEARLKEAKNINVTLAGSSPYDETTKLNNYVFPGKNNFLLKINDHQRTSSEKNGWGFVDFNGPMTEINLREQQIDSTFSLCGIDRIHPDNDGQMVMAYLFLKAQGLAGKKVAEMTIDAAELKTLQTENCKVSNLNQNENTLVFDYLAKALPYPIDTVPRHGWGNTKSQRDALKLVPFTEQFNQEILRIINLEKGNYLLKIDNIKIAEFSADDFKNGVNMALLTNTPQYIQAQKIMFLNEERFEVEKRFRDYLWVEYSFMQNKGLLFSESQQAVDTLNAYVPNDVFLKASYDNYTKARFPEIRESWNKYTADIVHTIYTINQPVEHRLEIIKLNDQKKGKL